MIKILLILVSLSILVALYLNRKEKVRKQLILAFTMALIITFGYTYIYTTSSPMIGRINLFPLILWTVGLVSLGEIYEKIDGKFKIFKILSIYFVALLTIEYIGYHLLNIRLDSDFPGILGMNVMYAPSGMKIFYLLAGPIFIFVISCLKNQSFQTTNFISSIARKNKK